MPVSHGTIDPAADHNAASPAPYCRTQHNKNKLRGSHSLCAPRVLPPALCETCSSTTMDWPWQLWQKRRRDACSCPQRQTATAAFMMLCRHVATAMQQHCSATGCGPHKASAQVKPMQGTTAHSRHQPAMHLPTLQASPGHPMIKTEADKPHHASAARHTLPTPAAAGIHGDVIISYHIISWGWHRHLVYIAGTTHRPQARAPGDSHDCHCRQLL
jgi:hypothetical protein